MRTQKNLPLSFPGAREHGTKRRALFRVEWFSATRFHPFLSVGGVSRTRASLRVCAFPFYSMRDALYIVDAVFILHFIFHPAKYPLESAKMIFKFELERRLRAVRKRTHVYI